MTTSKETLTYDHLYDLIVSQLLFDKREDVAQSLCFRRRIRCDVSSASDELLEMVDLHCSQNQNLVGKFSPRDYLYCLISSQLIMDDYLDIDYLLKQLEFSCPYYVIFKPSNMLMEMVAVGLGRKFCEIENGRYLQDKVPKGMINLYGDYEAREALIRVKKKQIKLLQEAKLLNWDVQDASTHGFILPHYENLIKMEQDHLNHLERFKTYSFGATYDNDLEHYKKAQEQKQQQVNLLGGSEKLYERVQTFSLAETYFVDEQFQLLEWKMNCSDESWYHHTKQIKQMQKTFHKTKIRNGENALFHALYRKEFFSVEAALHTLITFHQDQPLKLEYLAVKKVLENIHWVSWNEIQCELMEKYPEDIMDFLKQFFGGTGLFGSQYQALKMILREFVNSHRCCLIENLGRMMINLLERSDATFFSLGLPLKFQKEFFNGYFHKYDEVMDYLSPTGIRRLSVVKSYFKNKQNVLELTRQDVEEFHDLDWGWGWGDDDDDDDEDWNVPDGGFVWEPMEVIEEAGGSSDEEWE